MYNASRLNAYAMSAVHEALQDSGLKLTPELQEETVNNYLGIVGCQYRNNEQQHYKA